MLSTVTSDCAVDVFGTHFLHGFKRFGFRLVVTLEGCWSDVFDIRSSSSLRLQSARHAAQALAFQSLNLDVKLSKEKVRMNFVIDFSFSRCQLWCCLLIGPLVRQGRSL